MEDAGTTFCVENFRQAKECDDAELWDESMLEELSACIENGTWVTVAMTTLPPKPNIMKTKWIYKIKPATDGTVLRRKSRVVVDGSRQRHDQYDDTYSPVTHAMTIRLFLAIVVSRRLFLRALDIKTAFLYGRIPGGTKIYVRPPPGYDIPEGHCLLLLRLIYGLRNAPCIWFQTLSNTLQELGFTQSELGGICKMVNFMFLSSSLWTTS